MTWYEFSIVGIMKQYGNIPAQAVPLRILLADDDEDDRFLFNRVLRSLSILTEFATVEDGEELMIYLSENTGNLPDVLFMDINMPKKNGLECLAEIKRDAMLKDLPVIIYSTFVPEHVADLLYTTGAHYYVRKTDIVELEKALRHILSLLVESNLRSPARKKFILTLNG